MTGAWAKGTTTYIQINALANAVVNNTTSTTDLHHEGSLQLAVRSIDSVACITAAGKLGVKPFGPGDLILHLRNAGISTGGAGRVAKALASVLQPEQPTRKNFPSARTY